MVNYKDLFIRYMDQQGIKYTDVSNSDRMAVRVSYTGDNLKSIPVYVFFDKDGDPLVTFKCWEIANFKGEKTAAGILACNDMNKKYRWVKYYIDDDADVIAECDAVIDAESCGSECLQLVRRIVNITDEAYPVFMRYLYGYGG